MPLGHLAETGRSPAFSKYKVAVQMAGPWADLVAGGRIKRTPTGWPSRPLTPSDTRKFIRLWVKTLYQTTKGVQDVLVQGGCLPPSSGGAPDIELHLSSPEGDLAPVTITPSSTVRPRDRRVQQQSHPNTDRL